MFFFNLKNSLKTTKDQHLTSKSNTRPPTSYFTVNYCVINVGRRTLSLSQFKAQTSFFQISVIWKLGDPCPLSTLSSPILIIQINVRITRTWLTFDNCNFPSSATLISLWSDFNLSLESKVAALAYYYPHVHSAPIPFNNHVPTPHPPPPPSAPHSSEPFSNQGHVLIHESHPDRCQLHRKCSEVAFRKHTGSKSPRKSIVSVDLLPTKPAHTHKQ